MDKVTEGKGGPSVQKGNSSAQEKGSPTPEKGNPRKESPELDTGKKEPEKTTTTAKVDTEATTSGETKPAETHRSEQVTPTEETTTPEEAPAPMKPLSVADLQAIIQSMATTITEHTRQITELQEALARKRKPMRNGKVQIRDKKTGKVYPSKNNTYQSLLKAGELKELVDKGVFGDNPAKNSFGWFALKREWPDRFEEVAEDETKSADAETTDAKSADAETIQPAKS